MKILVKYLLSLYLLIIILFNDTVYMSFSCSAEAESDNSEYDSKANVEEMWNKSTIIVENDCRLFVRVLF